MKLKFLVIFLAGTFVISGISCQQSNSLKKVKLASEADSASYAIGLQIADNIKTNVKNAPGSDKLNIDILINAFASHFKGDKTLMTMDQTEAILNSFFSKAQAVEGQKNLEQGNSFLEKNKARQGVVTTASGLQYEIIKAGTGPKPKETDKVKVNYKGSFIDGTEFDSSISRGEPAEFQVNGVIKGWTEAMLLMPVGSKWKLYIPPQIGYGENGNGRIKPNSVLVFEVELLEIVQ
jgi:FKBP-type peptidyl-prolyl cis-trans isomerase